MNPRSTSNTRSNSRFVLTRLAACLATALSLGAAASDKPATAPELSVAEHAARLRAAFAERLAAGQRQMTGTSWPVTNCADSGSGSLRDRVENDAANGDTVDLTSLQCSRITLTTGAIEINQDDLTLQGPGAEQLAIDGNSQDKYANANNRVLRHTGTGLLQIQDLTIENAYLLNPAQPVGGCISSFGDLAIVDSRVSQCVLFSDWNSPQSFDDAQGGAIYARGTLILSHSTVSYGLLWSTQGDKTHGGCVYAGAGQINDGGGLSMKYSSVHDCIADETGPYENGTGGGIDTGIGTTMLIEHSTIANNRASAYGGGVFVGTDADNPAVILHSTISGNESRRGGGIYQASTLIIANSTVAANEASVYGGGLLVDYAWDARIESSIIADNLVPGSGQNQGDDLWLYFNPPNFTSSEITGSKSLIESMPQLIPYPASFITFEDPRLLPLADNGGPTLTHRIAGLLTTPPGVPVVFSPAIDAGHNNYGKYDQFDQRGAGYPRVIGASADMGATEYRYDRIFYHGFGQTSLPLTIQGSGP